MSASQAPVQLGTILEQEVAALQQMIDLLQAEHQALRERDSDALTTAVQQKQQQLTQLAHLDQSRDKLLQQAGHASNATGLSDYIRTQDDAAALSQLQTRFLALAADCQKQNQINAILAEGQRYHVERILGLLHAGGSTSEGYGRRGQVIHSAQHSTTVKA